MSSSSFRDKVVWITGGASGIGLALALEFASRGADVAVSGRRRHKLERAVEAIEARGARALAVPCDVTVERQIERAVETIVDEFGCLDVAIANAGMGMNGSIEELSAAEWRRVLDTNVVGCAITARHTIPHLKKTQGRLALIGSVMGTLTMPSNGAYAASKYAVRAIGQTLAMELASSGVSCTTVQPGFVESEIALVDNQGQLHDDWEDKRPQQLMWPADKAARVICEALARREREFTFTAHGKLAAFLGKHLPDLVHFAASRAPI